MPNRPLNDKARDALHRDGAAVASMLPESDLPRAPFMNGLVSAAVIVAGLYFGRELLMPLALAALLGFVLDPMVSWLKRRGVPRAVAVFGVVAATLGLLLATGFFIFGQLRQIGNDLPLYETNITQKLRNFGKDLRQPGMFDQYSRVVEKVEKELDNVQKNTEVAKPKADKPTRVEVVGQTVTPVEKLRRWGENFATPATLLGIVVVFVVLILLDKSDLRDRLLRLLGNNLHRATDALDEAGKRVSKYLTMQLVVNATYGIPMALGLLIIGVPGALVWGVLAAVLRFVPYVGPMIAAVFPMTLAFAVDPGWNMALWTLGLILTLELISNNVIEPWLYGTSTGLSTLSLIVAAMFWTALWGPIGLVLSTPLTVVLLVMGRYLPQLQFLEVLLGSERVLDEPTRLHQRLLAGDVDEAVELAVEHAEAHSPQWFYAEVGLGALRLASSAHDSVATAEHRHRVVSGMQNILDELRDQHPSKADGPVQVLCIGGRWAVDALSADMAAHALALDGIGSAVAQVGLMADESFARLDVQGASVVCLCYFSPEPNRHARLFIRKLKRRWPEMRVVVAAWNDVSDATDRPCVAEQIGADALVTTMDELVAQAGALLGMASTMPYQPAPLPEGERERLRALHDSGVLDEALRGRFDALAKRAADVFDCPIALVSLISDEWQLTHGDATAVGRAAAGAPEQGVPRPLSMCGHTVAAAETLVVPDVLRDPRFAANPVLKERGIRFYAGAPLRTEDNWVLGTLCLLDTQPRTLGPRDLMLLESMASEVMDQVATHLRPPDPAPSADSDRLLAAG